MVPTCWPFEKLNPQFEKVKNQKKEKTKEKALVVYRKPFKDTSTKCGKYGHKSTDPKCLENKEKNEKEGMQECKKKEFDE